MNKANTTTITPWSTRAKLALLSGAVILFLVSTMLALWISYSTEAKGFAGKTFRSSQQINEKVTLAIGTLHSMAAAHQASPTGFEQTQFEMFADNLVANQTTIAAAGRFDTFPHEDLELLVSDLQLHGLFQFEPKHIDDEGIISTLEPKTNYSTLIAFYPQDPVSANFIGLDFSELNASQSAIVKSIERNAPATADLPARWLSSGQLNIFASTYFGHYVPETVEDRSLQTDGGYFITLNLNRIIAQATGKDFPLSVGISVRSISEPAFVAQQSSPVTQQRFAASIFPSQPFRHNLTIGADSATIVYRTPAGVTKTQLLSAGLKGLGVLLLLLISLAVLAAIKTSRRQLTVNKRALAQERERALVTLNSLKDAVITTDSADIIDYINPAMLELLNTTRTELIGLPLQTVIDTHFTDESQDATNIEGKVENAGTGVIKRLRKVSSNAVVFDSSLSDITNQENNKIGSVLTMRDVSKEHALTKSLAHQATHDALTALPNRRKFETLLENILQDKEAVRNTCHVVGYIDLDQFKIVNDTVGHAAGDALLKKLATDLQSLDPASIEIARLGGDEFGFISSAGNTRGPAEVARLFYEFFQSYFYRAGDNTFAIRACIGLTSIKPYHTTINDVLSEVDIACYTAKDAGRNGYVIYDSEDLETQQREGEMLYLPMLQTALKENRFVLYTQPIVSTNAEQLQTPHHYECLLRLTGEDGDIITPYKFIVAAERYDLINDIDRWVIENAFKEISLLKGTALEDIIFSINLSGQSAVDPTMPDFIEQMLTEYRIKSSNICFELTETAVISNFHQAQKLIAFVRSRGCTIALDDFGAGASSFGYLKNLEVDYLKIDGQFVQEMTSNKVDFEMVRSMNAVGDALGIKTIAEFVESEEVMNALASISVDFAQGYFVGKPSPMADLLDEHQQRTAA